MSIEPHLLKNSRKSPRRVREKALTRTLSSIVWLIVLQMGFYGFVFIKLPHDLPERLQKGLGVVAAFLFMLMIIYVSRWFLFYKNIFKPLIRVSTQCTSALVAFALMTLIWMTPATAPIKRLPEIIPKMIAPLKSRKARHDVHKLTYYIIQQGISSEDLAIIAKRFGVTETELAIFFDLLKKQPIPPEKMKSALLEDALQQLIDRYNRISRHLLKYRTEYPEIKNLQVQAKTALNKGEFEQAENIVQQIDQQSVALAKQLDITPETLNTFFNILSDQGVASGQMHEALQSMTVRYHNNLKKLARFKTDNAEIKLAFDQANYFLEQGELGKAEAVINRASFEDKFNAQRDDNKVTANQQLLQAAEAKEQNADLTLVQERHDKAADYLQEAAKILPREHVDQSADYLKQAGKTLQAAGNSGEAKTLYEKGAKIKQIALAIDQLDTVSTEQISELAKQLAVSPTAIKAFFVDIKNQNNLNEPVADSLQRLANRYHNDLQQIAQFRAQYPDIADYPKIKSALSQASDRLELGNLLQGEDLLKQGVDEFPKLARRLDTDPQTLTTFFAVLKKQGVASEKFDASLREIAQRYYAAWEKINKGHSEHPEVKALLAQAQQSLQQLEFDQAEKHIKQASEHLIAIAKKLKVSPLLLETFLTILKTQSIADAQINQHLAQIAPIYLQNIAQLASLQTTDDSDIKSTAQVAQHALERGEMDKVDALLNQISAKNLLTAKNSRKMVEQLSGIENRDKAKNASSIQRLQQAAKNALLAAADAKARNAELKLIQFKPNLAAIYFQEAAGIVAAEFPEKADEYRAKVQSISEHSPN